MRYLQIVFTISLVVQLITSIMSIQKDIIWYKLITQMKDVLPAIKQGISILLPSASLYQNDKDKPV